MARFTKQVGFVAYQFNPAALAGKDEYAIEEIIIDELDLPDGIKSVFIDDRGNLDLVIYDYSNEWPKKYFNLRPGEWLTNNGQMTFAVVSDADFRKFATPAP